MNAQETCSICDQRPEDLLVLLCQHNLCVNCATQIYRLNQGANPFVCQICLSQTPLDEDTIAHFEQNQETQRISHESRKTNSNIQKPPKPKRDQNKKYKQNPPYYLEGEKNFTNRQPIKQQIKCLTHDEPVIYFCFDCEAADICSQCILTAKHANHKVSTFKKAAAFFEKRFDEKVREKETLLQKLMNQKSKYTMSKRHIIEEVQSQKNDLKEIFDGFARTISDQFAYNCARIEEEAYGISQIFDGCLAQIDDKLRILQESIDIEKRMGTNLRNGGTFNFPDKLTSSDSLMIYMPRLPNQIPSLNIEVRCSESIQHQLNSVLKEVVIHSQKTLYPRHENYSIQDQQSLNQSSLMRNAEAHFEAPRTVLKQSYMRGTNRCSNGKMESSRKLELSRCLDNATNIINKLQQRSRRAV